MTKEAIINQLSRLKSRILFFERYVHCISFALFLLRLTQINAFVNYDLGLEVFEKTLQSVAKRDFDGSSVAFEDATRFTLQHISSTNILAPHLVCVQYSNGRDFYEKVSKKINLNNVDMLSNDPNNNHACFVLYVSGLQLEDIFSDNQCAEWKCAAGVYPANLKVSPSLIAFELDQIESEEGRDISDHFVHKPFQPNTQHLNYRGLSINVSPPSKRHARKQSRSEPTGISITLAPGAEASLDNRRLEESAGFDAMLNSWKQGWLKLVGKHEIRALSWHSDITSHSLHHSKPGRSTLILQQVETVTDLMESLATLTEEGNTKSNVENSSSPKNAAEICGWDALPITFAGLNTVHIQAHHIIRGNDKEDSACMLGLIGFLSRRPEVLQITPLHIVQHSNHIGASITQSGLENSAAEHAHPLWDRGLKGAGQIIGISDTGLDDASCFFRDDVNGPTPRGTWPKDIGKVYLKQRKVIQYISAPGSDAIDYYRGHGTHVSGTVVGSRVSGVGGLPSCAAKTLQTCTGECLSDTDCAQLGLLSPCTKNANDDIFNRMFNCLEYGCDGNYSEAPGSYVFPDFCGEDTLDLLPLAEGAAPDAKVAFFDLAIRENFVDVYVYDILSTLQEAGAEISTHSWSLNTASMYSSYDYEVDKFMYEFPTALALFAASNEGRYGPFTIGSPSVAKNVLTVGSSGSALSRFGPGSTFVSEFSSRGPTFDRRIKPDVVVPGEYLLSASARGKGPQGEDELGEPSCAVTYFRGTSMATPLLAGHVLLVREYFETGLYAQDMKRAGFCATGSVYTCTKFIPSGALLKAVVIASAVHIGTTFHREDPVDENVQATYEGFGRVQLDTVLPLGSPTAPILYTLESFVTESRIVLIKADFVPARVAEGLKVTLTWMDPPNSALSSKPLLHDLDLAVAIFYDGELLPSTTTSSSGTYYKGRSSDYTTFGSSFTFLTSTFFSSILNPTSTTTTTTTTTTDSTDYVGPLSASSTSSSFLPSMSSSSTFINILPDLPYRTHIGNERTIGLREVDTAFQPGQDLRDNVNTVEQIELTAEDLADAVTIFVQISSGMLLKPKQPFALVMTGAVEVTSVFNVPSSLSSS